MQTSLSRSHSLRAKGLGGGGQGRWTIPLGSQSKDLVSLARVRGSMIIITTVPEPCPRFMRDEHSSHSSLLIFLSHLK